MTIRYRLTNFCDLSSPIQVLHYLQVLLENKKLITMAIDKHNYQALRNLGYTGESFNTVTRRLVESAEKQGE